MEKNIELFYRFFCSQNQGPDMMKKTFDIRVVAYYESWAVGKSEGKRHATSHQHRPTNRCFGGPRADFCVLGWS